MRLRPWIALTICLGLVLPAAAGPKVRTVAAGKVKGKPTFEDGKQVAFYIWSDSEGFHVRWTTDGKPTLFAGRIDLDKPIKDLVRVQKNGSGWVEKHGDRIIMFSSTTRGATDGFDLSVSGGKRLQMEMSIEGKEPTPEQVHFGAKAVSPPGFPLLIYFR